MVLGVIQDGLTSLSVTNKALQLQRLEYSNGKKKNMRQKKIWSICSESRLNRKHQQEAKYQLSLVDLSTDA